MKMNRKIMN